MHPVLAAMRAVASTTDLDSVLSALNDIVAVHGLTVGSIWPARRLDQWDASVFSESILHHKSVPAAFRDKLRLSTQKYGPSLLAQMAADDPPPFTITEAMQRLQLSGGDRWIIDLMHEHGIRDGFYCPQGSWTVAFSSSQVLKPSALSQEARVSIDVAANLAVYRVKQLMASRVVAEAADLSPRELSVLRHLAGGMDAARIAEQMGLSENSVRTYLKRAQKKLKANSQVHAAVLAVRQRLI
jgi:DNA-binding CsgD family transcriptional regulator